MHKSKTNSQVALADPKSQGMTYCLGLDQTWRQNQGPVILISKAASIANIDDDIKLTCITDS